MTKRNNISFEEKIINALKKLPNPIEDLRHSLLLYVTNNRARSNESRYEHIAKKSHGLIDKDILYIPEGIRYSKLRKDKHRKSTYEYIFKRKGNTGEYMRIYIKLDPNDTHVATIKTIFITKTDK